MPDKKNIFFDQFAQTVEQKDSTRQDTSTEDGGFNFADSLVREAAPFSSAQEKHELETEPSSPPVNTTRNTYNNANSNQYSTADEEASPATDASGNNEDSLLSDSALTYADTLPLMTDSSKADSVFNTSTGQPVIPADAIKDLPTTRPKSGWISLLLLMVLVLITWTRASHKKRVGQLINAFFSNRFISQLMRDDRVFTNSASIMLFVVFVLIQAIFLLQSEYFFQTGIFTATGVPFFLLLCLLVLLFIFFKIIMLKISAGIFRIRKQCNEYLFNLLLFNKILGFILLPIIIANSFLTMIPLQYLIYTGIAITGGFFFLRLAKTFYLGIITTKFSWVYIILYLCTLEILPLIVIMKVFIKETA